MGNGCRFRTPCGLCEIHSMTGVPYKCTQIDKCTNEPTKICKNCSYYVNYHGYGQCYAQKNAPEVDDNDSCESFKPRSEDTDGI